MRVRKKETNEIIVVEPLFDKDGAWTKCYINKKTGDTYCGDELELKGVFQVIDEERILCAAIKRLKPYQELIDNKVYYKKYCDIFRVETGWRHCDIMRKFPGQIGDIYQTGFLTSKCRYVDRKEAWDIAKRNGQLDPNKKGDSLFSEDIY